jgi:hypothetical protein
MMSKTKEALMTAYPNYPHDYVLEQEIRELEIELEKEKSQLEGLKFALDMIAEIYNPTKEK